jgi:hypothetical protein
MKKAFTLLLCVCFVFPVGGCATAAKDVTPAYVSPMHFQSFDCSQLVAESARLQVRVQELGGRLDQANSNDKALVAVGVVLFWPALFFVGNKNQEAEFARLKGEYDALQQQAIEKKCPGAVVTPTTTMPTVPPATAIPTSSNTSAK